MIDEFVRRTRAYSLPPCFATSAACFFCFFDSFLRADFDNGSPSESCVGTPCAAPPCHTQIEPQRHAHPAPVLPDHQTQSTALAGDETGLQAQSATARHGSLQTECRRCQANIHTPGQAREPVPAAASERLPGRADAVLLRCRVPRQAQKQHVQCSRCPLSHEAHPLPHPLRAHCHSPATRAPSSATRRRAGCRTPAVQPPRRLLQPRPGLDLGRPAIPLPLHPHHQYRLGPRRVGCRCGQW